MLAHSGTALDRLAPLRQPGALGGSSLQPTPQNTLGAFMGAWHKHCQHSTCNQLPARLRTFSPALVVFMSSYFCLSAEMARAQLHSPLHPQWWVHSSAAVLYLFLFFMRGNIYIFIDKSQAVKGFIEQKMSLRTEAK